MPRLPLLRHALCALLALCPTLAAAQGEAARAEFATLWAAPTADAGTDSEALRAYPLYPWLVAARLRTLLAQDPTGSDVEALTAARRFADAAGDVPHVRDLRRALLTAHIARGDPAAFLADWREAVATEVLRCQKFDARLATGDTAALAQDIADRWLAEAKLPAECDASLAWLRTQSLYTPALIERRVRARLLDGDATRARALLTALPVDRRARYEGWMRQLGSPAAEFAALGRGSAQLLDSEGLTDAWGRFSRKSPNEAMALLDALATTQKLSPAQKQALQAQTALGLAWNRDPQTVALFKQVPETALDERGHEWRIRAALWAGDWNQAFNWLTLLPDAMANQPRWRYWNARALESLGQKGEAYLRFTSLAKEHDPYGLLAAARTDKGWTPIDEPNPVRPEQRAALEATPAFVRAREAWLAGIKPIASLEWADAIGTVPDSAKPALVREAAAMGWPEQAIVTATRLGIFRDLDVLFPRPYAALVKQSAADANIAPLWVYSVMRKESAFKPDAVSGSNAVGLLQMLPSTAAMTANAAGRPAPGAEELKDPNINVPLGALHLRELLDKAEGHWPFVLAAYNAGFNAPKRWRPAQAMDADVWIENIPFNETRTYVQRILFHAGVYQWLETGKPVRAQGWLLPVQPAP